MKYPFLQRFGNSQIPESCQGFTLTELLVAAFISLGMLSLGGFGLVSVLTSSQTANAQNERRTELNRSLEFISAEIRQADRIEKAVSTATLPDEFTLPADAQPVLMLYPNNSGSAPIIYYMGNPVHNTWRGPKVVYRWGPSFDNDGKYQNLATPTSWAAKPLIDAMEETNLPPACSEASWSANGTSGFGACVNAAGKVAELFHAGIANRPVQGTQTYTVQTLSATRSAQAATPNFIPPPGADPAFTVTEGIISTRTDSTMSIRVLGGEISCNPDGTDPIPTESFYNLVLGSQVNRVALSTNPPGSQNDIPVAEDTRLTVDSRSTGGPCGINIAANSETDNQSQVLTLRNGDSIPDYAPFGNQRTIDSFLSNYIDPNQIVTIAENEVIFLFELGSTNSSSDSFDMQDLAVLATITPTTP